MPKYDDKTEKAYVLYKKTMDRVEYIDRRINRIPKEEQYKPTYEMPGASIPKRVGNKTRNKQQLENIKALVIARLDSALETHFSKNSISKENQLAIIHEVRKRYENEKTKDLLVSQELSFQLLNERENEVDKGKDDFSSVKRTDAKTLYQSQVSASYLLNERNEANRDVEAKSEKNNTSKIKDEAVSYNFSLELGLDKFSESSIKKSLTEKDYNYSLELNFDKFDNKIEEQPLFEKSTDKGNLTAMQNNTGNYNFSLDLGFDSLSETVEVNNTDKDIDKGIDMDR